MSDLIGLNNIDDVTCAKEMSLADLLGEKEEMNYVLGEDGTGPKIEVGMHRLKISDDDVRFSVTVKCKEPGAERYATLPKDANVQTLVDWVKAFVTENDGIKIGFFTSKTAASVEAVLDEPRAVDPAG